MITPLTGTLKRSIQVDGAEYTALLSPTGIKLTPKGKRKGVEFTWSELLGREGALVAALNASLGAEPAKDRMSS